MAGEENRRRSDTQRYKTVAQFWQIQDSLAPCPILLTLVLVTAISRALVTAPLSTFALTNPFSAD